MRVLILVVLALVVGLAASGCGLFQPRQVEIDPTPVMVALRAELDQGKIEYGEFEKRIQAELGVAVTAIQATWEATAPAVSKSVVDAVKAEAKANPPTDRSPIGLATWLLLAIVPSAASAAGANMALKTKKAQAPAPGVAPVPTPTGGAA